MQCRELAEVDPGPRGTVDPAKQCDIGDREPVTYEEARRGGSETFIEDTVETLGFGDVAVYCIGNLLRGVAEEMICLALHGADASVLKESV